MGNSIVRELIQSGFEVDTMETQIATMLAVSDGNAAINFYRKGFGAELLWELGEGEIVAGLSIGGAKLFLAHEAPAYGTRGPSVVGFTTVENRAVRGRPHRSAAARSGGRCEGA